MKKTDLINELQFIIGRLKTGCSDVNCIISKPEVGTNGGCHCLPRDFAHELMRLSEAIKDAYPSYEYWIEEPTL